ncbi:hypothetical protein [Parasitella parasitica]|uniref:Origin recognition complex subunit 6 n=1 Tax=Parasitella parasitica TaxID=35722 RepID=A0A0B7NEL5_9FUNG|nr:hypothetical protein [Parasitella parasitica]
MGQFEPMTSHSSPPTELDYPLSLLRYIALLSHDTIMANPIAHCLERLNLQDDKRLKQKAVEFQGQLSNVPAKIFDKGPNCKVVVCIQLAYESLGNYDWNLKLGSQLAGCKTSAYEAALSIARQRLNIQPTINFEALTVALGSSTMLNPVKQLWAIFEEAYQEQFTGATKLSAKKELKLPCWKGAVIFSCAKAFGEHLSKEKLHELCACTKTDLTKCIKIVEKTCAAKLGELKISTTKSTRNKRSRKQSEGDDEKDSDVEPMDIDGKNRNPDHKKAIPKKAAKPVSGIVSMINQQDYTTTKRFKEFSQWKSLMIDQLQQRI